MAVVFFQGLNEESQTVGSLYVSLAKGQFWNPSKQNYSYKVTIRL